MHITAFKTFCACWCVCSGSGRVGERWKNVAVKVKIQMLSFSSENMTN